MSTGFHRQEADKEWPSFADWRRLMVQTLRSDVVLVVGLFGVGASSVVYLFPELFGLRLQGDPAWYLAQMIALVFTIWALVAGLGKIVGAPERRFWITLTLAYGSWMIACLARLKPTNELTAFEFLFEDGWFLAFYLLSLLAVESRPDANPEKGFGLLWKSDLRFEIAGLATFVTGLLVYFVVIPSLVAPQEYLSNIPSASLYPALDILLLWRLYHALRSTQSRRWRAIYSLVTVGQLMIFVADVIDFLDVFFAPVPASIYALWYLYLVPTIVVARLRHVLPQTGAEPTADPRLEAEATSSSSSIVAYGALLPALHVLYAYFGILGPQVQRLNSAVVLVYVVIFAALLRRHQNHEAQRNQRLEAARLRYEENLRRAKRDAEAARKAAETANRAKSQFLANMSHEIRTPISGLIGLSGLILREDLPPDASEHSRILRSTAHNLLGLIDDILDFSKIEAGGLSLEMRDFSLGALFSSIREQLGPGASAKGIELRTEVSTDLPERLSGDPTRLRQVLVNLVGNAIKFTTEGEVVLRAAPTAGEDAVRFSVTDTGIGIPLEVQDSVFAPFIQGDGSTSRRFGGTGLGLAISTKLVEMMGGRMDLESVPDEGSAFWFEVRLSRASSSDTAEDLSVAEAPERALLRGDYRVLLAEDNPVNRLVAKRQLEALGYRVEAVEDGSQALRALEHEHYDLVLMDCQMPGLDGFETTRRIRARETEQERLPIVALTASVTQNDIDQATSAGMDEFISKPCREDALAASLDRWLLGELGAMERGEPSAWKRE